jgi:hypothetical protein
MPEAALSGETTEVAVYDNFSERFLGEAGWQATKVLFGPYEVRREGGAARVVIGPEIVNQIEEYANVKLMVGPLEQDIGWPDDVVPAPGAAKIGGIMGTALKEKTAKGTLTAKIPEAAPAPEPEPAAAPKAPSPPPQAPVEKETAAVKPGGKAGLVAGLVALALIAVGVAYWMMNRESAPEPAPVAVVEPPLPVPPLETNPCSLDALSALAGFAAQAEALASCAGEASADDALGLVERAAAADDPQALLLFGTVYDGAASAGPIEEIIGLTFGDVPATAAEYYARAVAAGSEEARVQLDALCERMAAMTDTLARGAVADFCND